VIKNRIARGTLAAAAVLAPVAGFTALAASPAGAVAKGITCSKLSGSANTTTGATKITLSGCNGNTGGKGTSKGLVSDTSTTTKWVNGKSTTYSVSATAGSGCASGDLTEVESGVVSADTTKSTTVGATVSATVCVAPSATNPAAFKLTLLPGTKYVIAA
jgi:hypothetical protein